MYGQQREYGFEKMLEGAGRSHLCLHFFVRPYRLSLLSLLVPNKAAVAAASFCLLASAAARWRFSP